MGLKIWADGDIEVKSMEVWKMNALTGEEAEPAYVPENWDNSVYMNITNLPNHDFSTGDLTGWITEGDAFQDAHVTAEQFFWGDIYFNPSQRIPGGYHLWGFNEALGGDSLTGTLRSINFILGGNGKIDFLVSGGRDINNLYVALVRASDGKELFKVTGTDYEEYQRIKWDASAYIGQELYIKVVDNSTGGFGHINVDDFHVPVKKSGGGSSTPASPAAPAYQAEVISDNGTKATIPVIVDKSSGIASIDSLNIPSAGNAAIAIDPIPDISTYSFGIPVADLSYGEVRGTLTISTVLGDITIPSNMLSGLTEDTGEKAEIIIGQADRDNLPDHVKEAIGDKPIIQLSLSVDGKQTEWNNPSAPVTVSIPYTPSEEELAHPESIVIWYIDGAGNIISVPNGCYDPESGKVTFTTTHFSRYAVAYNHISFIDVMADALYSKAVSFIAARGITSGTGKAIFSPDAILTRGQFITMAMRAFGIEADQDPADNFADAGNTYYTGYLAAAKRLGISDGIGNNLYAPDKEITKQEMHTMIYRILKTVDQLPEGVSGKTLSDYTDAGNVASYAREAITFFIETGIINNNSRRIDPQATVTRVQMAQLLYDLLTKFR